MDARASSISLLDLTIIFAAIFTVGILILIAISMFFRREDCRIASALKPKDYGWKTTPNESNVITS